MRDRVGLDGRAAGSGLPVLAWSLLLATVVASAVGVVLAVVLRPHPDADVEFAAIQALLAVGYGAIGAIVASRAPRNVCGWILISIGLFQALSNFGFMAGIAGGATSESAQGAGGALLWLANWIWLPSLMLLATFLPLLFPDGRLPSPRWRWFAGLAAVLLVMGTAAAAVVAWVDLYGSGVEVGGDALDMAVLGGLVVAGAGSIASLVVRYRRSAGVQRQQLKVIAVGGAAAVTGILLTFGPDAALWPALVLLLALPGAVGVAILRYRLFEIDRLISRTVSYLLLTGLLAAVYAAGVVGLRPAVARVTGDSTLAVVGSTVAVAALFGPARRRIQSLVDRRFNRARYDAVLVVEQFSGRLRDQLELDQLNDELVAVVTQTVAPARVAVWLTQDPRAHIPG